MSGRSADRPKRRAAAARAPARQAGAAREPARETGAGQEPARRSAAARAPARRADPARHAALELLLAVGEREAYANLLLPGLLKRYQLTGRDAALATELSYGTLRGRGSYDAVLEVCSDRDLAGLEPPVREVLRLGTHQLLATRIKPHAAVATSVDLIKDVAGGRPAGFVNAVLRRVATRDMEEWMQTAAPSREADLTGHLAVRYSHPRWIVEALADALGETVVPGGAMPETEALLAADDERPRVHLCAVPGLAGQPELVQAGAEPARWSPFGAYLADGEPSAIPAIADSRAGVQDEASQLVAAALTRAPIEGSDSRWLDLCSGPGGKARLLAGLAGQNGARLAAAELREHRARLVRSATSLSRSCGVLVADGLHPAWQPGAFDRVIADVPCSGLGALRRRPEARWRRTPQDVIALGGLQRGLLSAAAEAVRPGGVVAYATCSPHLAETRDVVGDVLAARGDMEVLNAPGVLAEVPGLACTTSDSRYAQFWPHRHGTDAMFLALLRRRP